MNILIRQLKFIEQSILQLFSLVDEQSWKEHNFYGIRSIFEICHHITFLVEADLLLANSVSEEEMTLFYKHNQLETIQQMKHVFSLQMNELYNHMNRLNDSEEESLRQSSSYWGITYTQEEWGIEIFMHLTHHRSQLHLLLKQSGADMSEAKLFE